MKKYRFCVNRESYGISIELKKFKANFQMEINNSLIYQVIFLQKKKACP